MSWLDRRRGEEKASEAEQKLLVLRQLIERHPAGVAVTNDAGTVVATSLRFRTLFGELTPDGLAGASDAPCDPGTWSSDPARFRRRLSQVIAERQPVSSEDVVLADGRAFERDYAPMDLPGAGAVHVFEYRDITQRFRAESARREAAARLQFLVNVGQTVLYSCRPTADHDRTFVSENAADLLGYDTAQWLEPGFWRQALHPDDAARVQGEIPQLRERGQQVLEYRLQHADGHAVKVRDEMRLICETEGRPHEIVGWLSDVTAHRRTETELTSVGRIASTVVHDFRNLLLVVAGHAHLLKAQLPPADAALWHVEEIARAAESAAALTDRLRGTGTGASMRQAPPVEKPASTVRGGSGETVLIVEDEDSVRLFALRALSRSGYKVLEARRGEEALEIAARHSGKISAVVTDLAMPGMSGYELARRLAAEQPRIKVILMSGYDAEEIGEDASLPASLLSFLPKPFTPDVLATRVRQILDN